MKPLYVVIAVLTVIVTTILSTIYTTQGILTNRQVGREIIDQIKVASADRYHASDAARDLAERDVRIGRLEREAGIQPTTPEPTKP